MANDLRIRLPDGCPKCAERHLVKLQQTIMGSAALLTWCCGACDHSWPVSAAEEGVPERRMRQEDRRVTVRTERRRKVS